MPPAKSQAATKGPPTAKPDIRIPTEQARSAPMTKCPIHFGGWCNMATSAATANRKVGGQSGWSDHPSQKATYGPMTAPDKPEGEKDRARPPIDLVAIEVTQDQSCQDDINQQNNRCCFGRVRLPSTGQGLPTTQSQKPVTPRNRAATATTMPDKISSMEFLVITTLNYASHRPHNRATSPFLMEPGANLDSNIVGLWH